jgi:hypothetical protein
MLSELGFTVDSSISTAGRIHGGGMSELDFPGPLHLGTRYGCDIVEIPVPGVSIGSMKPQLGGGGYLRALPPALASALVSKERYQVLYLHPHDFDRNVPFPPGIGVIGKLRRRLNIGDLAKKVRMILSGAQARTCGEAANHLRSAKLTC